MASLGGSNANLIAVLADPTNSIANGESFNVSASPEETTDACVAILVDWADRTTSLGRSLRPVLKEIARLGEIEQDLVKMSAMVPLNPEVVDAAATIHGTVSTISFVSHKSNVRALKTVAKEPDEKTRHISLDERIAMVERETAAYTYLQRIKGHELHILSFFGMVETERAFRMMLEKAEVCSAESYLAESINLSLDARLKMALELAEAVRFVNRHGVRHRDIALRNLARIRGRWVLIDFGLARVPGLLRTESPEDLLSIRRGPLQELPPESIKRGVFDESTEVFMVGRALTHIFTGTRHLAELRALAERTGFASAIVARAAAQGLPPAVQERIETAWPDHGPFIYELIERCLSPVPCERPTLFDLVEELGQMCKPDIEDYLVAKRRRTEGSL